MLHLDRRVTIQSATEARDAHGQAVTTWATFAEVAARRRDTRSGERAAAQQTLAARSATYRIRWRAGITEKMRLVDDGVTWQITGIADNRREGWMELACEAINPAAVSS